MKLRKENRIDEFESSEGIVLRRQASPLVKMKNDEAYRDWASTVLSYNTELLKART